MDEERRLLLEKLLQLSIDELEKDNLGADQKKLALQRLRHIRECLLDSSKTVESLISQTTPLSSEVPSAPSPAIRSPLFRSSSAVSPPTRRAIQSSPPASTQVTKTPSPPRGTFVKTCFKNNSDPDFLTHRPRASLAQSSFAWMLGDDPAAKTKTAFVSPSNRTSSASGGGADGLRVDGTWSPDADEGFDLGHLRRKR
jgi:TBC1 domain family protein 5